MQLETVRGGKLCVNLLYLKVEKVQHTSWLTTYLGCRFASSILQGSAG